MESVGSPLHDAVTNDMEFEYIDWGSSASQHEKREDGHEAVTEEMVVRGVRRLKKVQRRRLASEDVEEVLM